MFKIKIIQVGKTKEFQEPIAELEKRLNAFADLETVTVETDEQILNNLSDNYFTVLLAIDGKQVDSVSFSKWLEERKNNEGKVQFIIGGPHGVTPEVTQKADFKLSFSKMTFTHQMVRPILLEQLYRGFTIMIGKKYHY